MNQISLSLDNVTWEVHGDVTKFRICLRQPQLIAIFNWTESNLQPATRNSIRKEEWKTENKNNGIRSIIAY